MELPHTTWARILLFSSSPPAAATAREVNEAVPICLAELAENPGVAAYLPAAPSLADAFAGALLFPHDEILAGHFAERRAVVAAYLNAAARPSLTDFAAWLFERPELQPLIQRSKSYLGQREPSMEPPRVLSFGLVKGGLGWMGPKWVISRATMDTDARDLLCALQGIAREQRPGFPYLWIQIHQSLSPRRPFVYQRDAVVISLPNGQSYDMAAGIVVRAELREPGITVRHSMDLKLGSGSLISPSMLQVSFTLPMAPHELRGAPLCCLENAGFVIPDLCSVERQRLLAKGALIFRFSRLVKSESDLHIACGYHSRAAKIMAMKRISKELTDFSNNPPSNCFAAPIGDNLFR